MSGYIPFLRVAKLKDRELESVLTLIIKVLVESGLSLDIITKVIADFSGLLQKLQQALNRSRRSELTAQIQEVDALRDKHVISLFKGVDYFRTLANSDMVTAADAIDAVLEKYGSKMITESNSIVTVKIRTLIKELKEPELVVATDSLSLTTVVDSLNATNEQFDALYLQRATEDAENDTPTLIPTRRSINDRCYMLVYLINFLYETEPETYGSVAGDLAEIIGDLMAVAKSRETRNSHEEEEIPTEPAGETPAGENL